MGIGFQKKHLKPSLIVLLGLGTFVFGIISWYSEPLPKGMPGEAADQFAREVERSIGKSTFDSLSLIEFSFRSHHYQWNKAERSCEVRFDSHRVKLDLIDYRNSEVFDQNCFGSCKERLISKALGYFYNDSYWLVAPFKFFDPGVERQLVYSSDGERQLLITHTTGGTTPGDSYLWSFDSDLKPKSFRLWVSIIPIKGVEASWEGWNQWDDLWLSTSHRLGPLHITIDSLKLRR